ncbi:ECF-type riboflavin transporter substrate-binding protein [Convivina praedatoris]|uniref:UPF0397 protein LMG032447_01037 n=1 Tax=Convivina praedatoris TaxID=2880963 RepID=A0ABM9D265_9LACO|nr:ECF-type riboflavin transporter substrate-binding protein [Convivina sp. LMG 32447]CAH1853775.1 hypothetical protein R077815_00923 [Convivina sp. LMG 32447]CAH1854647.1 hypothetical protein R078138_00943 [Convivina sp. LMG 32447]CAH1855229.1 hypothetical protein LMG032447_01037 [Convivina sp. LMG 32447]
MKKNKLSTRSVVAIGIGAAVFLILFKFIAIPTGIPNTQVNVAQSWLSLLTVIFGPLVGFLVAVIGHSLNDAISYGSIWWSWVIADGIYALIFGLLIKKAQLLQGKLTTRKAWYFNLGQAGANIVAWTVVAPVLDIFIYSEPANKVIVQGLLSTVINIISTAVIGTALLGIYTKNKVQKGHLVKED